MGKYGKTYGNSWGLNGNSVDLILRSLEVGKMRIFSNSSGYISGYSAQIWRFRVSEGCAKAIHKNCQGKKSLTLW